MAKRDTDRGDDVDTRDLPESGPLTDFDSRVAISDAEYQDRIEVVETIYRYGDASIPDSVTVVERLSVYHGPEVVVHTDDSAFLLTAPGPDRHLLLWSAVTDDKGFRRKWEKLAEVKASLSDDLDGYTFCDHCGDPIRTADHARQSALGVCTDD